MVPAPVLVHKRGELMLYKSCKGGIKIEGQLYIIMNRFLPRQFVKESGTLHDVTIERLFQNATVKSVVKDDYDQQQLATNVKIKYLATYSQSLMVRYDTPAYIHRTVAYGVDTQQFLCATPSRAKSSVNNLLLNLY